jgi:hypothetical protein
MQKLFALFGYRRCLINAEKDGNGRNRDSRFQFGRAENVTILGSVEPPKVPIA